MGFSFDVCVPLVDNEAVFLESGPLRESLQNLALAKAGSIAQDNEDALILGADTVVVLGDAVLGKPKSSNDAKEMIRLLSGNVHTVMTGVALVCKKSGFEKKTYASTNVWFRNINEDESDDYIAKGDWQDKAGAYAIQGNALVFIDKIDGCYYNVVGLPVKQTIECFAEFADTVAKTKSMS
jgi:septum formation protein